MADNIIGISFVILHGIIDFDIFLQMWLTYVGTHVLKQSIRNTTFLITNWVFNHRTPSVLNLNIVSKVLSNFLPGPTSYKQNQLNLNLKNEPYLDVFLYLKW